MLRDMANAVSRLQARRSCFLLARLTQQIRFRFNPYICLHRLREARISAASHGSNCEPKNVNVLNKYIYLHLAF